MVETDIANCFEAIPHKGLMAAVEERIVDRHVLKLLRSLLSAGVMEDGAVRRSGAGTPQGGVISPVGCTVYLHRLDRQWQTHGRGVLCRYGNSTVQFDQIIRHADTRLAVWVAKRDQQHRRYGWQTLAANPDCMGLISLNGTIVAPRPNRPWRPGR